MPAVPGFIEPEEVHGRMEYVDAMLLDGVMHAAYAKTSNRNRIVFYLYCEHQNREAKYADRPQFYTLEAPITCLACLTIL